MRLMKTHMNTNIGVPAVDYEGFIREAKECLSDLPGETEDTELPMRVLMSLISKAMVAVEKKGLSGVEKRTMCLEFVQLGICVCMKKTPLRKSLLDGLALYGREILENCIAVSKFVNSDVPSLCRCC